MHTINDGGIDAYDADCSISIRLYGCTKFFRRMKDESVSVGTGFRTGRAIALGGTSAMVETGSAGASNKTPSIIWEPGLSLTLRRLRPRIGVHFIRTITNTYRPQRFDPIGLRFRKDLLNPSNHRTFIIGEFCIFPRADAMRSAFDGVDFAGHIRLA